MKKLIKFSSYISEDMLKEILILKKSQLESVWQSSNYCADCLKILSTYCTECKMHKKNDVKKVKRNMLIIMKKEVKNIVKTKISINLKLIKSDKKLIKKQMTFCKKIQNNAEYNMFEDNQDFYEQAKSASENFNNISKNENADFIKLSRWKLKNEEKIQ